jgi:creatinine amidohydrolase
MATRPVSNCIGELAWPDIQWFQKQSDIVMIPVGSLEQHGAHLPTLCDSLAVQEITKRISAATDVPYYPLVWTGYAPHHLKTPEKGYGTITLRPSTFCDLMYDIGRSAIHHGWNKIVYLFGHASNAKVADPFLRKLRYDTNALIVLYKPYSERDLHLIRDIVTGTVEDTPGWHAGEMETSEILAINEKLVHMERAVKERAHTPAYLPQSFLKEDGAADVLFEGERFLVLPMEHMEFTDSGVIGDPFAASKEKGEKILQRYAEYGIKVINELKKIKSPKIIQREFDCRCDW